MRMKIAIIALLLLGGAAFAASHGIATISSCSLGLNFSQGCNSQYVGTVIF